MFINGLPDYNKNGEEVKTGLVAATAIRDGELRITNSGKEVGSVSVRAYNRKDGTAAFITVKGWGHTARQLSGLNKGDSLMAAGRIETREYNGKNYTDLVADFVLTSSHPAGTAENMNALQGRMDQAGFAPISGEDGDLPF